MSTNRKKNAHALSIDLRRRDAIWKLGLLGGSCVLSACGGSDSPSALPASAQLAATPAALPQQKLAAAQPPLSGPITQATVAIDTSVVGQLPTDAVGVSIGKSNIGSKFYSSANTQLIAVYKSLGNSLLRIGGTVVDHTVWTPSGTGNTSGQVAPPDIDALADFLQATGWSVLYGINLMNSTPELAAQEVAYAEQALGSSLYGIEIGNEPANDKYTSFANFLTKWQSFATAIRQSSPNVRLTGPAATQAHIAGYVAPFAQQERAVIELLTFHYYKGDISAPLTVEGLLSYPDTVLQADLAQVSQISGGMPFRVAETNSISGGGVAGVSNSYASALWAIDHIMTSVEGGATGVNFQAGGAAYTPYNETKGPVTHIFPEYYGMLFVALAGSGNLLDTKITANDLNASAYTVRRADGSLSLIIVNKDAQNNLAASISLPGTAKSATLVVMQGAAPDSLQNPTIQGASVNADGSFSLPAAYPLEISQLTVSASVPAASAVLVRIVF